MVFNVIFETITNLKNNGYDDDAANYYLGIPGKYKIDTEKKNSDDPDSEEGAWCGAVPEDSNPVTFCSRIILKP